MSMTSKNYDNQDDENVNSQIASFNGGKMKHIFDFDKHSDYNGHLYNPNFVSDEAEEALKNGRLFYKIDGSNGMIIVERNHEDDGDHDENNIPKLKVYQRLDTRGKPPPQDTIPLPAGCNPDEYEQHTYYYKLVSTENVTGKKLKKINQAMLALVDKHKDHLLSLKKDIISVEWVGAKFNRTPGVPNDVELAVHSEQVCNENIERTFDGVRRFLLEEIDQPVEGLIIEHEGLYWKIRSDGFDPESKFKTEPDTIRPPTFLV